MVLGVFGRSEPFHEVMAKRIIELHHGSIEVRSTSGVETVFRVKLPLLQQIQGLNEKNHTAASLL
jgi:hypothetical protein